MRKRIAGLTFHPVGVKSIGREDRRFYAGPLRQLHMLYFNHLFTSVDYSRFLSPFPHIRGRGTRGGLQKPRGCLRDQAAITKKPEIICATLNWPVVRIFLCRRLPTHDCNTNRYPIG